MTYENVITLVPVKIIPTEKQKRKSKKTKESIGFGFQLYHPATFDISSVSSRISLRILKKIYKRKLNKI